MDPNHPSHQETPLDLEAHEGDTGTKVWMRRILFGIVILLCVSFAAPTFGSCSGALGSGGHKVWGTYTVGGKTSAVAEDDFRRVHSRLSAAMRLLQPDGRIDDDHVWATILLDAAARADGVHVSDAQVSRFLAEHPAFQTAGKFDPAKYREEVRQTSQYLGVDHEGLTSALKMLLRTMIYRGVWISAASVPDSRGAFDEWRKTNTKVSVDYVVQPFAPLLDRSRQLPVTDDDLRRIASLPPVLRMRTLPARVGIEAAFVRAADVTAEQQAAMEKFVADNALLPADQTLEAIAWREFWGNHSASGAYTRDNWLKLRKPAYEKALREWEALPEPRPVEKPKEPLADGWPEKPADQFYQFWHEFVSREVLAREVIRHMAGRAERESKSLAELAPEYAALGVRVVSTAEPVSADRLPAEFPEGLGRDTDVEQLARTKFVPAEGRPFAPVVSPDPFPTTRFSDRPAERGWAIARSTAFVPAEQKDVFDVREQAEAFFRDYRANELAIEILDGIRKKVEAAGDSVDARRAALAAAAKEAGLEVRSIRRFNASSERPRPGEPGPAADAAAWRNRVMEDYAVLARCEPGKFRDPNLIDDAVRAGWTILVTERHDPDPIEMDASTLRMQRILRTMRDQESAQNMLSPAEVKKRYRLELTEEGRKATEKTPEEQPSDQ